MRHPVVISSLEEDFEQIGLTEKKSITESADASSEEELTERQRKMHKAGKRGFVKAKVGTSSQKRKWRMAAKKRKSKRKAYYKSAKGRRARKRREKLDMGLEPRTDLLSILEDVQEIVSKVEESNAPANDLDTTVRSFANIAIISEMLSDFFGAIVEDEELSEGMDDELKEDVASAHQFFTQLAEQAAEVATDLSELDEDEEIVAEELEKIFQEQMDALVDGLEFYADLTEEECGDEDEDEDEDMEEAVEESAVPSFRERMASARRKMDR